MDNGLQGYQTDSDQPTRSGPKPQPRMVVSCIIQTVRLTPIERALLVQAAAATGTSVSDILREGAVKFARYQLRSEALDS